MQYPNQYRDILQDIVANSLSLLGAGYEIASFYYGESRRIEEGMKSPIAYPCLWAELPQFSYTDTGDNIQKAITCNFIVFSGCPIDDYAGQDEKIDHSARICEKVAKRLKELGYVNKGTRFSIEPGTVIMSDNGYGCRVSLTIQNMEGDFLC